MTGELVLPVSSAGALSQALDPAPHGLSKRVAWATYRMAYELLQECKSRIFQYIISFRTGTRASVPRRSPGQFRFEARRYTRV